MRYQPLLVGGLILLAFALGASTTAASAKDALPPFADVRRTVEKYFEAFPDLEPDDLIHREQVDPLLAKLRKQWLPAADARDIAERLLDKKEFLVSQLSTPKGREFMRQIGGYQGAYDRLDRLSWMPHGEQTVRDLIRGPGGEKMLEYMTQTPGGKELGKMLSNAPTGKDFNDPTGRIYTPAMLLDKLEECHTTLKKKAREPAVP